MNTEMPLNLSKHNNEPCDAFIILLTPKVDNTGVHMLFRSASDVDTSRFQSAIETKIRNAWSESSETVWLIKGDPSGNEYALTDYATGLFVRMAEDTETALKLPAGYSRIVSSRVFDDETKKTKKWQLSPHLMSVAGHVMSDEPSTSCTQTLLRTKNKPKRSWGGDLPSSTIVAT